MTEFIFIVGIVLITTGVACWNVPAALVVLGVFLSGTAFLVKAGQPAGRDA